MEILLTFQNTHAAVKSDSLLNTHHISAAAMPLPESLGDFCGISLRIEEEKLEAARALLEKNNIVIEGIFAISEGQGKKVYLPWHS